MTVKELLILLITNNGLEVDVFVRKGVNLTEDTITAIDIWTDEAIKENDTDV